MRKPSLSGFQSVVGVTAGVISIVGAVYSAVQFLGPPRPTTGDVLAVVQEARSDRPVADATVEFLTAEDALVTTVTPEADGRVHQRLKEGQYRLRVSHPRFGAEFRQIQVVAGQTAEVRIRLAQRPGGSSPLGQLGRTLNEGVGAVERVFRGFGL